MKPPPGKSGSGFGTLPIGMPSIINNINNRLDNLLAWLAKAELWTFWDYKFERWPKDKGMRLDHFLLSPKVSDRLVDGGVGRWVRGQVNASDHAPTWIALDL